MEATRPMLVSCKLTLKKAKAVSHGKYGTHAPPGSCAQPVEASASSEAADDEITTRLMASLDVLLPSLVAESVQDFDLEPPVVLVAVLTQSNILGTIAALLRNDSLEDATKRMRLYKSTLNVVTKLGSHHATAGPAIHHTRQVQDGGSGILRLSFTSSSAKDEDAKFEEAQSLASCLRNFDKQSKNMLLNAKAHPQAFAGPDTEQMLTLCRGVSELADFLLANAAAAPAAAAAPGGPGQTTPCARDDWQFDLAVLELPDDDTMSRHSYGHLAASAYNLAPGRMKSLSLQLSNLTTSLPPGIFVRHCASRLDVMKILIVGPKGTPYENGLFEFDLFCPSTFPNSPPNMLFRTTGGGRVRFNPNLYNCGKVCLSLLGTWAGEAWSPGKSTILQVLVSIQAMIFCDEPWYNEPGRGTNHSASMDYNRELQGYTVRHAMLDWLKPEPDPVWGDIVERHFANNATAIERMVVGWGIDHATLTQLSYAMGGLDHVKQLIRQSKERNVGIGNNKHTAVVPSPLKRSFTAMAGEQADGRGFTYLKRRRLSGEETLSQVVEEEARGNDRRASVTRSVFGSMGSPEREATRSRPTTARHPPETIEAHTTQPVPCEPSPTEPNTPSDPGDDEDAPRNDRESDETERKSFSLINYDPSSQAQAAGQSAQLVLKRTSRAEMLKLRLRVAMYKVRTNQVGVSFTDLRIHPKHQTSGAGSYRGDALEKATSEAVEEAVAELRREAQALLLRPDTSFRPRPKLLPAPVLLPTAYSSRFVYEPLLPSSPPASGSAEKRTTATPKSRQAMHTAGTSPDRAARRCGWEEVEQELTSSVVKGRVAESLIGLRGAA
ncbi:hypothetical protein B0A55_06389 [Friedmanniomyces simplex]|uniref:UBC core domain-containing protein n=1 Tax=Friedmanniomyces simplex TaxID=329884 RepID=A0A4U0XGT7_9PEZI|nr:hypothetical protein B0A55_06389 [Friedmanniomyces simplex]